MHLQLYCILFCIPIASPLVPTLLNYFKSVKSGSMSPSAAGAKPSVMFTGVIDKEGEKKIKLLGGFLADSVYGCTHLITDKV